MTTEVQKRPFPDSGHTLIVNGIGSKSVTQLDKFLYFLAASGGIQEVLGLSLEGVHKDSASSLERYFKVTERSDPFWRRIFPRSAERAIQTVPVIANDAADAIKAFNEYSGERGDSASAVLHIISYERMNANVIRESLAAFKEGMPTLDHFGVIIVPPGDIMDKRNFDRTAEECPPESLGVPIILMDKGISNDFTSFTNLLREEQVLVAGIAGLVANRRTLPGLNPHNYLDLMRFLTDQSQMIGISMVQRYEFWELIVKRAEGFDAHTLMSDLDHTLDRSAELEESGFTSLPRMKDASQVVTIQLPLPAGHKFWNDYGFKAGLDIIRAQEQAQNTVLSFGSLVVEPVKFGFGESAESRAELGRVPMITVRFYPTERVPGWNLIMKLVEGL